MGRFQLESIYLIFHRRPSYYIYVAVLNININIIAGTTVENKGKLILVCYSFESLKKVTFNQMSHPEEQLGKKKINK